MRCLLLAALLPAAATALKVGQPQVDPESGLAEAGWNDPDIILDKGKWWKLPSELFKQGEPRPYPPKADYHSDSVRNASKVMVLVASLEESKVVTTLRMAFERAAVPSRVYVGVVQQNGPQHDTPDALEEMCREFGTPLQLREEFKGRENLHRRQSDEDAWGHSRYTPESLAACEPASRVRMYRMSSEEAKGPAYARSRQPLLLSEGDELEDFCMQIDAHTIFVPSWDDRIINQWADTDNEYAVLSTYPTNARDLGENGTPVNSNNHWEMPHMCEAGLAGGTGIVRNAQASAAAGLTRPAMSKLWAAGLSFSRCHAERDVPADPSLMHVFNGEEFGRGARLWTNGYDFYTLARPVIGTWYGGDKGGMGSWKQNSTEIEAGDQRLAALLGKPSDSSQEARSALKGYNLGTRRSLDDYAKLTGLDPRTGKNTKTPCAVSRWTPWKEGAQPPYQAVEGSAELTGRTAELRAKAY